MALSMTFLGKLMALFPATHAVSVLGAMVGFVVSPSLVSFLLIPIAIYFLPLIAFHIHNRVFPLEEGTFSIVKGYSPWFGTHMIQQNFISFKAAEEILRTVPGLFPLWLRAWGSQVGRSVYIAPHFEIADRSLLVIGDNAIFGYGVKVSCHVISPSREHGGLKVYIRIVRVDKGGFVGAAAQIAPGVHVKKGALVKATTDVYPDTVVEARG